MNHRGTEGTEERQLNHRAHRGEGIRTVPQSEEWTVERFGRYTHTLTPGLNLIIPIVDSIGRRVSMRETVLFPADEHREGGVE